MEFIQKNIWLVMIAVVSGIMLIWPLIAKRFSGTREVGVADAVQMINRQDAVILDVREPAEFKQERIHGYGADPRIQRCHGSMSATLEPCV